MVILDLMLGCDQSGWAILDQLRSRAQCALTGPGSR